MTFSEFVENVIETPICCELKRYLDKLYELYEKDYNHEQEKLDMDILTREMTFEEEYVILQKEAKLLFDKEDRKSEPPESHCVVRRALRCIKNLVAELEQYKKYNELPCEIGSDVYYIPTKGEYKFNILTEQPLRNCVQHQTVERIIFGQYGWRLDCKEKIFLDALYKITWFLTQEEAELALKEMDGNITIKGE